LLSQLLKAPDSYSKSNVFIFGNIATHANSTNLDVSLIVTIKLGKIRAFLAKNIRKLF